MSLSLATPSLQFAGMTRRVGKPAQLPNIWGPTERQLPQAGGIFKQPSFVFILSHFVFPSHLKVPEGLGVSHQYFPTLLLFSLNSTFMGVIPSSTWNKWLLVALHLLFVSTSSGLWLLFRYFLPRRVALCPVHPRLSSYTALSPPTCVWHGVWTHSQTGCFSQAG